MTLFHILSEGFNIVPGESDFHQPMKVVINTTRVRFVDFDHWQKVLVCNEDLVLMIEQTREKHSSPEVLLKFTRHCEELFYRCFLLMISPLHRWCFLRIFRSLYISEQSV